jgi:hypothetical protein
MFRDNHVIWIVFGIVEGEPYNKSQKITHVYQFLKISSLKFGWYIISLKYPLQKRGGGELFYYIWMAHVCELPIYYTYSLKGWGLLCLIIVGIRSLWVGIRSLPSWPPMSHDLHMFRFTITTTLYFRIGKVHMWGTFPKCRTRLYYGLIFIPGPLIWECPTLLGLYPISKTFGEIS